MKRIMISIFLVMSPIANHPSYFDRSSDLINIRPKLQVQLSPLENSSIFFVPGLIMVLLAGKIGYDISSQSYRQKDVADWYNKINKFVESQDIKALCDQRLYDFFNEQDIQAIVQLENEVRGAYDSWIKPWNWTISQKESYKKIELFSAIVLHGPLFAAATLDEQGMINHARKICCLVSEYPLVHYVKLLDHHMHVLSGDYTAELSEKMKELLSELRKKLLDVRLVVGSSKEYLSEFYSLKTHTLLEQIKANRSVKINSGH